MMPTRKAPSREEVISYLKHRRNWGRWGPDDQLGALNLITAEKRVAATRLVRNGHTVSLSRYLPKTRAVGNVNPAQHYMFTADRGTGGAAMDYYGISYHGRSTTHIDALCHVWDQDGMWNGRDPSREISFDGARWGAIDAWSGGIFTRGVLLDIPRLRGEPYVTQDKPVHGWDLEGAARAQGVAIEPGDAVSVYSGREKWQEAHPNNTYGTQGHPLSANPDATAHGQGPEKPGLHPSCLPFLRDNDVSVLAWDMMDLAPDGYDLPWSVHGAIFAYGIALLDNCLLQPLAEACREEGRYEFMLVVAPLKMAGGTGSPANPIAMF
jgi:kynurenine formamidase